MQQFKDVTMQELFEWTLGDKVENLNFTSYYVGDRDIRVPAEGYPNGKKVLYLSKKKSKIYTIETNHTNTLCVADDHLMVLGDGRKIQARFVKPDWVIKTIEGLEDETVVSNIPDNHETFSLGITLEPKDTRYYDPNGIVHNNTFTIEKTLKELGYSEDSEDSSSRVVKLTGHCTPWELTKTLYKNSDSLIVIDDCDTILNDELAKSIIKSATASPNGGNVIQFNSDSVDDSDVPFEFTFNGKIIIVSNMKPSEFDHDGSIRTRGLTIDLSPTQEDARDFLYKRLNDIKGEATGKLKKSDREAVFEYLMDSGRDVYNMRSLKRALNVAGVLVSNGMAIEDTRLIIQNYV